MIPGFEDAMTDFTSEGPARLTNDLKPDISAPGFDIQSTEAGTGNEGTKLSGTSMAAPHVSGVATLLRQLHPNWPPARIKAAMMNQCHGRDEGQPARSPVSATVMGAGRVEAFESAKAGRSPAGQPLVRARPDADRCRRTAASRPQHRQQPAPLHA